MPFHFALISVHPKLNLLKPAGLFVDNEILLLHFPLLNKIENIRKLNKLKI
jgi:hypothetical protein